MNYKEFKETLKVNLEKHLAPHIEVYFDIVEKNNSTRKEVVTFLENGVNMMPAIHLKELYDDFEKDNNIDRAVSFVLQTLDTKGSVNEVDIIGNWPDVKDKIMIRLINYEWNRDKLQDVPYKRILDLAAVFQIRLHQDKCGEATMRITLPMLKRWGISKDELYETALTNLKQEPYLIKDMNHIIAEILNEAAEDTDEIDVQYVLTNQERMFGAAGLLRADLLKAFADKIGGNFYILPSSVHELIFTPDNNTFSMEELTEMVSEINQIQVEEAERLSNNAYYYHRETGQIAV